MNKKVLAIALLCAGGIPFALPAQNTEPDDFEIVETEVMVCDSICHEPASVILLMDSRQLFPRNNRMENPANSRLMQQFYNIRRQFQDPRAPRFILIDRKGRAALGIGGYVKGTVSADFKGIAANRDFITYQIPTPNNSAENGQFQMGAATSRLFLSLVGSNRIMGEYVVYVESDFRGGSDGFLHLRQAYIDMHHIKAGMAWSTFSDPEACPPTIDFQGPCGMVSERNVILQYHQNLGKHWSFAIAAEDPTVTISTVANENSYIRQRIPDFPMYVQYEWGQKNSHVRASGILRGLSYRNLINESNRTVLGWGVQLSGLAHITNRLVLYFDGVYGRGIADYINDLGGNNFDLIPQVNTAGKLEAPENLGLTGGIQFNICPRMFASAAYSHCRLYGDGLSGTTYKYAQYVVGNVFYNLTKNCQLGVEYLYGRRTNRNGEHGSANRLNAMIQYNF